MNQRTEREADSCTFYCMFLLTCWTVNAQEVQFTPHWLQLRTSTLMLFITVLILTLYLNTKEKTSTLVIVYELRLFKPSVQDVCLQKQFKKCVQPQVCFAAGILIRGTGWWSHAFSTIQWLNLEKMIKDPLLQETNFRWTVNACLLKVFSYVNFPTLPLIIPKISYMFSLSCG